MDFKPAVIFPTNKGPEEAGEIQTHEEEWVMERRKSQFISEKNRRTKQWVQILDSF